MIRRVNFTWALPGGMWVEYESGGRDWLSFADIDALVGAAERERLYRIAYAGGMCGMWYNAENGRNVFVAGKEVN